MQAAQACDEHLERTGKPIGPLHGLPVSVKEQLSVGGHRTNAGIVAWVDNPIIEADCHLVHILKKLGAVVFARTQEPQSFMHLETSNNIYGACVNPRNRRLTAGGSSGGETALMALCGSVMGFGGDIGGSIRCPASYNGVSCRRVFSCPCQREWARSRTMVLLTLGYAASFMASSPVAEELVPTAPWS